MALFNFSFRRLFLKISIQRSHTSKIQWQKNGIWNKNQKNSWTNYFMKSVQAKCNQHHWVCREKCISAFNMNMHDTGVKTIQKNKQTMRSTTTSQQYEIAYVLKLILPLHPKLILLLCFAYRSNRLNKRFCYRFVSIWFFFLTFLRINGMQ